MSVAYYLRHITDADEVETAIELLRVLENETDFHYNNDGQIIVNCVFEEFSKISQLVSYAVCKQRVKVYNDLPGIHAFVNAISYTSFDRKRLSPNIQELLKSQTFPSFKR